MRLFRLFAMGLLLTAFAGGILVLALSSLVEAQPTTTTTAPKPSPNPVSTSSTVPASATQATQPVPDALPAANPAHGQALYNQQCLICHDVDGEGDGPVHTLFIPEPANLTAARDAPAMAKSIVLNGLRGTAMPAHQTMSDSDFNDIIAYVETMPLDTTREWSNAWSIAKAADTALAQSVYSQACADCHGQTGKGDGPWAKDNPYIWPRPTNFTAQNSDEGRTLDIITNGIPGSFMAAQAPKFTERARYALTVYVNGFLDPKSPDTIAKGSIGQRADPYTADNQGAWKDGQLAARFYCEYCHGGELNGTLIAPKLTDRQWLYDGGTDAGLFEVIQKGIPGKLMPPHNMLPEDTRWRIITFIRQRGGLPDPLKVSGTYGNPSSLGGASTSTTAATGAAGAFAMAPAQNLALTQGSGATIYVDIKNDSFDPANIVVAPGTRVVWTNHDATSHTTTMNNWDPTKSAAEQVPGAWDSGPLAPGASFSAVFTQPGTSMYQCMIHPYMFGSVSVDISMVSAYSAVGRAAPGLGWWWAAIGVGIVIVLVLLFFSVVWGRWIRPRPAVPHRGER